MSYFEFPHTRNYEGDLGYLIKKLEELTERYNTFFEYNAIRFHDPLDWVITSSYPAWNIVYDPNGEILYISKKEVPAGIDITNTDYWEAVSPFKIETFFSTSSLNPVANKTITNRLNELLNMIAGNSNAINNEITNRTNADNALSSSINTIGGQLADEITNRTDAITTLSARMDEFTTLPDESTAGDAELADIRIGYDGTTYNTAGDAVRGQVEDLHDLVNEDRTNPLLFSIIRDIKHYGNMWDSANKAYGYYAASTGILVEGGTSWYYSPTYIPVTPGDLITYNNTRPIITTYDENGDLVASEQGSWAGYTIPATAKYARFSISASAESGMYIFVDGTSIEERAKEPTIYIPRLETKRPPIVVSMQGSGDYTSLTEALYATADDHPDVIVEQGVYDIVAEYKALFGNTIFDTMTYNTPGMKGFQWGLYIDNRTVTFLAGARVECDLTGYTNDGSRRFSPFNLAENAVLDGLFCYAVNPYYIIHDDFGTDAPFTNIIKNCVLISPEPTQGNIIGGGCKKLSVKIVDNCYLDNGTEKPVAMRYHNSSSNGAQPTVIIKNTRANSKIRVNYYGTQTSKMTALVNNCSASAIEKAAESGATVDNVDLYEWCNEVDS